MRRVAAAVAVAAGSLLAAGLAHAGVSAAAAVDDPLFSQQWGLTATNAPAAWRLTTGSAPVVVAVVDTGVDASHPDLAGRILPGWNAIDGSTNTGDDNGHGTEVAGIIAAASDNGTGVASYCWRCRILPVKVLGPHGDGSTQDVARGIRWAADHGARVINVSLGTFADDTSLQDAVAYARSRNAVVVAAAGNAPGLHAYPAGDTGALAVAGSDANGQLYPWSNSGSWIQLAAPGSNLTTSPNDSYADFVGTSAAAPVVSGIAALLLSADPQANADAIIAALEQTAHPTQGVSFGVVDAAAALQTVLGASRHRTAATVTARSLSAS